MYFYMMKYTLGYMWLVENKTVNSVFEASFNYEMFNMKFEDEDEEKVMQ
jgi:hypothetical protein